MRKIISLAFALMMSVTALAQPSNNYKINIVLELKYDSVTKFYTVYGTPDTSIASFPMATAQITVMIHNSLAWQNLNIIPDNFGAWQIVDTAFAGAAYNYHYNGVGIFVGNGSLVKNVEKKYFHFKLNDSCYNFVRLIRNGTELIQFPSGVATATADPQDPTGFGRDFYNYIGNGLVTGVAGANTDAYLLNDSNYGWHCGPFPSAPLATPIEQLNVLQKECTAVLNWKSLNEDNIVRYEIEASTTFSTWKKIGDVVAKESFSAYAFTHENPERGTNIYRVKIIYKNGEVEYSNTVRASIICSGQYMADVYPNPASDHINFKLEAGLQDEGNAIKAQVIDVAGNLVAEKSGTIKSGICSIKFDCATMANGAYLVRYTNARKGYSGVVKFDRVGK